MYSTQREHLKGALFVIAGVFVLSPDALLVRLIQTDILTLLFWRGLLSGLGILAGHAIFWRGHTWNQIKAIGKVGLLCGLFQCASTTMFVLAIRHTSAANVLVILAATPLFTALLSRIFLKETVSRRTWIAIGMALGGIALLFSGSLQSGGLLGDLIALLTTLLWASYITAIRLAKSVNMAPALGVSGLLLAVIAYLLGAHPLQVSPSDINYLLLLGLVVVPLSFTLITHGPRYLPSPEVSLILLLESVLGPYWVWLVIGEAPTMTTLLAGCLIIGTLAAHALSSRSGGQR